MLQHFLSGSHRLDDDNLAHVLDTRINKIVIERSTNNVKGLFAQAKPRQFRTHISDETHLMPYLPEVASPHLPAPLASGTGQPEPVVDPLIPSGDHTIPGALDRTPLTKRFWLTFWKQRIHHKVRNVWWRLLIRKLPTGTGLHVILPEKAQVLWRLCQQGDEDDTNFLFGCLKNHPIWQAAHFKYFEPKTGLITTVEPLFYLTSSIPEP